MRKFKLINVTRYANDDLTISRLLGLGYTEVGGDREHPEDEHVDGREHPEDEHVDGREHPEDEHVDGQVGLSGEGLDSYTKPELIAKAKGMGLEITSRMTKDDIIELLQQ